MSEEQIENIFDNKKTVTKTDILPLGDWIELSKHIRSELITSQTSRVEWFKFEKEALYHFFRICCILWNFEPMTISNKLWI